MDAGLAVSSRDWVSDRNLASRKSLTEPDVSMAMTISPMDSECSVGNEKPVCA